MNSTVGPPLLVTEFANHFASVSSNLAKTETVLRRVSTL
jgi:hypothetical protein